MAGEVIYADLNVLEGSFHANLPGPSQQLNNRQCPCWHRVVLTIGCVGNIVLVAALTVLSVMVFQVCSSNATSSNNTQLVSHLRQSLCEPQYSNSAGASCNLCPLQWLLHLRKCYWVSKITGNWSKSHEYCSLRKSHLLVIHNSAEMGFITNITKSKTQVWIGLHAASSMAKWSWVDGSFYDDSLFKMNRHDTYHAEGDLCAILTRQNQVVTVACSEEYKWICQKEAVPI
ncbi:killer cell lectin-like receptor subfamily B member 1B allele B [Alligator sinensis]|uniref:Killer cell lectin-like receptor subfamily B member 1B allele B n=1 Tax=Alligator sinensis TaxID=38654 RepID=A0A3Q0H9Z7_ALLSI|nr:killer cell lectin-like receptor subfamily B member 1B allele B [Alligator sinensis]